VNNLLNSPSHDAAHLVCAKKRGKITDIFLNRQCFPVFFDSFYYFVFALPCRITFGEKNGKGFG
jgi:hypothetical protein